MPEIFRQRPYRFFFYSNENDEPPHIHVRVENRFAKVWLEPVHLEYSHGMRPPELRAALSIIEKRRIEIINAWNGFFGT
jgi:hypothetical protein